MPILIDGHNVIGQMRSIRLSDHDDEAKLVMLLRRFANQKRGRKVVVIFDGGSYGHPDQLNGYGVEVRFARSPSDADSELIRRIRAVKRRDEWTVVSSDHAIVGAARAHGVTVISAQHFAQRLELLDAPKPNASLREKRNDQPLSPAEVAEWLRLFGISPEDAED